MGLPLMTVLSTLASACELSPKQPCLVLVDLDAHLPGGLEPVIVDVHDLRIFCHHLGQLQGDLAHLR